MKYNFDEDFENGNIVDRVSNGEDSDYFVEKENEIYCSDGTYICDVDDEERQDKIDEYKESWRECNWSTEDWADYYGCDPKDVEDCMNDDMRGF